MYYNGIDLIDRCTYKMQEQTKIKIKKTLKQNKNNKIQQLVL